MTKLLKSDERGTSSRKMPCCCGAGSVGKKDRKDPEEVEVTGRVTGVVPFSASQRHANASARKYAVENDGLGGELSPKVTYFGKAAANCVGKVRGRAGPREDEEASSSSKSPCAGDRLPVRVDPTISPRNVRSPIAKIPSESEEDDTFTFYTVREQDSEEEHFSRRESEEDHIAALACLADPRAFPTGPTASVARDKLEILGEYVAEGEEPPSTAVSPGGTVAGYRNLSVHGGFGSVEGMLTAPQKDRVATPLNPYEEIGYVMQFYEKFRREEKLWTLALDKPECKVWKRFLDLGVVERKIGGVFGPKEVQLKPERVLFFYSECIIDAPPEVVLYLVQNIRMRMSWEDNFAEDTMLEGTNYRGVERVVIRSPVMTFSNREIIRFRDCKCLPAFEYPYLCYERSTSLYDHIYNPSGKVVRVNVFMSGNTVEPGPRPGTTLLRVMTDSNPGGMIPSAAVNLVVANIPRQWAIKLSAECKKFMAKETVQPLPRERLRELMETLDR
ncbi:unnamed protein product [Amoebophrya sp. A25]|nr:unnamed protein product [Amoebophrya sp. A25]|eukprot:GSA25T00005253001.1